MTIYTDDIFFRGADTVKTLDEEEANLMKHLEQVRHKRKFLERIEAIGQPPSSARGISSKEPQLEFGCGRIVQAILKSYPPVPLALLSSDEAVDIIPQEDYPEGAAVHPVFHRRMCSTSRMHYAWEACWWSYLDKVRVFVTVPLAEGFEEIPAWPVTEGIAQVHVDPHNFFLQQFALQ